MKLEKIRDDVLEDVRERGFSDEQIEAMDGETLFNEYCMWNGLIGYGFSLWNIVLDLKEAETQ